MFHDAGGGAQGQGAVGGGDGEMLGADAEDDFAARGAGEAGRERSIVDGDALAAQDEGLAGVLDVGAHEVHGGRADEACHEEVGRLLVKGARRADLL